MKKYILGFLAALQPFLWTVIYYWLLPWFRSIDKDAVGLGIGCMFTCLLFIFFLIFAAVYSLDTENND